MSHYKPQKITLHSAATPSYAIVDEDLAVHYEATDFLTATAERGRAINTLKKYAGDLATYLNYCESSGISWHSPNQRDLTQFLRNLANERAVHPHTGRTYIRSNSTANAIFRTTLSFLEHLEHLGISTRHLVDGAKVRNTVPLGTGYNPAHKQWAEVTRFRSKLPEGGSSPPRIGTDTVKEVLSVPMSPRDDLLVHLLATTGIRVGEALGLRHEDLHLLGNNSALGCTVKKSHIHIIRRMNANNAIAKSRYHRHIPITHVLVSKLDMYSDFLYAEGIESDYLFVNTHRGEVGAPLQYQTVYELFKRLSRKVQVKITPHSLRHYCASEWRRLGTAPETIQSLLGHRSPLSMHQYIHASPADLRSAIEKAAPIVD
ncbi:tyrosine-type recombinase/integrase [Dietzia cinnamea]|uniref:tyrosine-type recombinase/integrase n=1 Tax=Dietzia cinnamea TaxID=321318 RepID=UPI0021A6D298|nr:tyrosine-type recombinase/integrase [Dietzia cinnamea]MCT2058399.1 tyrosine-type recombinase/integrase [Dietzia cinnamea]